jgi:hypothetical protein
VDSEGDRRLYPWIHLEYSCSDYLGHIRRRRIFSPSKVCIAPSDQRAHGAVLAVLAVGDYVVVCHWSRVPLKTSRRYLPASSASAASVGLLSQEGLPSTLGAPYGARYSIALLVYHRERSVVMLASLDGDPFLVREPKVHLDRFRARKIDRGIRNIEIVTGEHAWQSAIVLELRFTCSFKRNVGTPMEGDCLTMS